MRNKLAVIIAVVLGILAVFGVHEVIKSQEDKYQTRYNPVHLATARQRIKAGTKLEMKMMQEAGIEAVEGPLTDDHVLENQKYTLLGRVINRDVTAGQPLMKSYFRQPMVSLSDNLKVGERAVALSVDTITGVAGSISPGSHIDILGTFSLTETGASGGGDAGRTTVMLCNVTVLAVDGRTREARFGMSSAGARRSKYSSITVALEPEEASLLVHAQSIGELTMLLRKSVDSDMPPPPADVHAANIFERAAKAEQERRRRLKVGETDLP